VEIQAHAIVIVHNGLASNNSTNLEEETAASTLIGRLKKRKIIKGKGRRQGANPTTTDKEDHPPPQNTWGYQGWYDRSRRTSPLQGGAGYCILKENEEIGCGTLTIPFGTNNVREFKGALGAVILAKAHTKKA
jgi:hypothetical protein